MPDDRRRLLVAGAAIVAMPLALGGCGGLGAKLPAQSQYRLPTDPPDGAAVAPAAAAPGAAGPRVGLVLPVKIAEYLDRDAIVVPSGAAGMRPLEAERWAEPLREAVGRTLRADLARLLGEGRVWPSPLPPGVVPEQQVRAEVVAFEAATPARRAVRLDGRWTVTTAAITREHTVRLDEPVAGGDVDALVVAHRAALWRWAQAIAASLRTPAP